MASTLYCENDVLKLEAGEPIEWVRGNETELLARLSPLVREQSVLLNFSQVERIDAAGLAMLIALYREAGASGHSFAITNPATHVSEILTVVGLDRVLVALSKGELPALETRLARNAA